METFENIDDCVGELLTWRNETFFKPQYVLRVSRTSRPVVEFRQPHIFTGSGTILWRNFSGTVARCSANSEGGYCALKNQKGDELAIATGAVGNEDIQIGATTYRTRVTGLLSKHKSKYIGTVTFDAAGEVIFSERNKRQLTMLRCVDDIELLLAMCFWFRISDQEG
jgi:hypothetical protein